MNRMLLSGLVSFAVASTALAEVDLLIVNGRVVDGTGNPWFYGDVAIDEGRIVAVGDLSDEVATRTIDATGLVVAPGFIDVHTHVDDDLIRHPLAENFVRNGVTTIVSGNCGGSELDVGAYLDAVDQNGAALHGATLVGHNSVLRKVKGASVAGKLSEEQLAEARDIVDRAMRDGAVGFSTGLIYTPGTWSDTDEIIALAKVSASHGGIYATHMRSESTDILAAIDEAIRIGREAGCRVQVSHFKLPTDVAATLMRSASTAHGTDATLARVVAAREAGLEIWLDQYPYTASSTTINTLLPDWVLEDGPEQARALLRDPATRERVLEDMRLVHEVTRKRADLGFAVITSATGRPDYSGKSVKLIAQLDKLRREQGQTPELLGTDLPEVSMREQYETVIEIYLGGGAGAVFHSMDEREVSNIMAHDLVAIASDSGMRVFGEGMPHPRGYGTNTRVLGRYVRELGVVSLEDAVRKMTSLPATAFRFDDRGLIRVGLLADVTIFDPATVIDRATFENPHQWPEGIRHVIVAGVEVFDGADMTGAKPGRSVRGPGYRAE